MPEIAERADRIQKLASLRAKGIEPYPSRVSRTHTLKECIEDFETLAESKKPLAVVGRIRSIRRHGGSTFLVLEDGSTARVQIFVRKDEVGDDAYAVVKDLLDMGDFLQAKGAAFLTKTGEKSILVSEITLLCKSLLPLPERWHGLSDVETRYRMRELDLLSNPAVRDRFVLRSKLVSSFRRYLDERSFMEVETPILQAIPGGANARPFITHHNALDQDMYLRVAPELYLKRLIVGGFEKVYEIGRLFRNEGIDHAHNPEFTAIELYWAFVEGKDFFTSFLEDLLRHVIRESCGTLKFPYGDAKLDFGAEWPKKTFREVVFDTTGVDIDRAGDEKDLEALCKAKKISVEFSECVGIGAHYDQLFTKAVRPTLTSPIWIFDYPTQLKPLARKTEEDATKSASMQLIVGGEEIVNAYYHELNDPLDQRQRFCEQETLRERGSVEAQFLDEEYLASLEYGLPPTSGMGIGIDRLVAFLTNSHSVKEVILFPTLRSKQPIPNSNAHKPKKAKETC